MGCAIFPQDASGNIPQGMPDYYCGFVLRFEHLAWHSGCRSICEFSLGWSGAGIVVGECLNQATSPCNQQLQSLIFLANSPVFSSLNALLIIRTGGCQQTGVLQPTNQTRPSPLAEVSFFGLPATPTSNFDSTPPASEELEVKMA
jgi:hypothetical protein